MSCRKFSIQAKNASSCIPWNHLGLWLHAVIHHIHQPPDMFILWNYWLAFHNWTKGLFRSSNSLQQSNFPVAHSCVQEMKSSPCIKLHLCVAIWRQMWVQYVCMFICVAQGDTAARRSQEGAQRSDHTSPLTRCSSIVNERKDCCFSNAQRRQLWAGQPRGLRYHWRLSSAEFWPLDMNAVIYSYE